jgi:hypothetical protein
MTYAIEYLIHFQVQMSSQLGLLKRIRDGGKTMNINYIPVFEEIENGSNGTSTFSLIIFSELQKFGLGLY